DASVALPFDRAARVAGKGTDVGWRDFTDVTVLGPIEVADLLGGPSADAHAFVLTALDVARPVDVLIVAGRHGPLTGWLGDTPLFSWDGDRPLTDWQHTAPVRLAAGTHHLLAQVGHRTEDPRLMVRVVDRHGLAPPGVTARPPRADDVLAGHGPAPTLP